MDSPTAEQSLQTLDKFCKNLTTLAREGKLDPVIGRDEEIRRAMQVLSRRTKNNPLLIGEPGVGKTAIAEGLAQRIIQGDVPDSLKGKQLFALVKIPSFPYHPFACLFQVVGCFPKVGGTR